MLPNNILNKCKAFCLLNGALINSWIMLNSQSICIKFSSGTQMVFTYIDDDTWSFETIGHYLVTNSTQIKNGREHQ